MADGGAAALLAFRLLTAVGAVEICFLDSFLRTQGFMLTPPFSLIPSHSKHNLDSLRTVRRRLDLFWLCAVCAVVGSWKILHRIQISPIANFKSQGGPDGPSTVMVVTAGTVIRVRDISAPARALSARRVTVTGPSLMFFLESERPVGGLPGPGARAAAPAAEPHDLA